MSFVVHVSVVRYIPCHELADLFDVRVGSLDLQVVSEVKMCVVKDFITNRLGCKFNDRWVGIRNTFVIEIFCSS